MDPLPLSPGTGTSSSSRSSRALMFSGVRAGKAESELSSSDVVSPPPGLLWALLSLLFRPFSCTRMVN